MKDGDQWETRMPAFGQKQVEPDSLVATLPPSSPASQTPDAPIPTKHDFRKHADTLVKSASELIHQVLVKHSAAVLEGVYEAIQEKERENAALRAERDEISSQSAAVVELSKQFGFNGWTAQDFFKYADGLLASTKREQHRAEQAESALAHAQKHPLDPRLNGTVLPVGGRVQVDAVALGLLHQELSEARERALEEAAKVAETHTFGSPVCAAAIRALGSKNV